MDCNNFEDHLIDEFSKNVPMYYVVLPLRVKLTINKNIDEICHDFNIKMGCTDIEKDENFDNCDVLRVEFDQEVKFIDEIIHLKNEEISLISDISIKGK